MKKLKLFVWTGFCPDYTDGMAFAIAPDEKAARALVLKRMALEGISVWGDLAVYPVTRPIAFAVSGGG